VYASSALPASSQAFTDFLARYEETYGEEPPAPYHGTSYDAVNLFLDAVEAVGTVDADGNLTIDRSAIAEYIRSVENFEGLTGVLNAEGNGDTAISDIGIYQVQEGEFALINVGRVVDDAVEIDAAPAEEAGGEEAETEATEEAEMEATAEATQEG
jgi:ABC-type branched-subunit amino acid transport system substrate-binding protein